MLQVVAANIVLASPFLSVLPFNLQSLSFPLKRRRGTAAREGVRRAEDAPPAFGFVSQLIIAARRDRDGTVPEPSRGHLSVLPPVEGAAVHELVAFGVCSLFPNWLPRVWSPRCV